MTDVPPLDTYVTDAHAWLAANAEPGLRASSAVGRGLGLGRACSTT